MGAPRKHRKGYVSHLKRWDKAVIDEEAILVKDYALKNKKEVRKVEKQLSQIKTVAKSLNISIETKESQEAQNFVAKLKRIGYLNTEAQTLDEVLDITVRDIFERRLSNVLYKNKLARTASQARQFIVHGHVLVGGKCIDSPSYSVSLAEEAELTFVNNSSLLDDQHPERVLAAGGVVEVIEEVVEEAAPVEEVVEEKTEEVKVE